MSSSMHNERIEQAIDQAAEEAPDYSGGEYQAEPLKQSASRGSLLLFALVLAGIGAVYLMFLRTGPRQAGAVNPQAAAADQAVSEFLTHGAANLRGMEQSLDQTQKVVEQFLSYPSMAQVPLNDLKTNPFRHLGAAPDEGESDGELARRHREAQRATMLKAVQNLQLQTIVHGETRKACMINNTLYQEGQQVDGFTIEKIKPGAVVVKNGVYRFELRIVK